MHNLYYLNIGLRRGRDGKDISAVEALAALRVTGLLNVVSYSVFQSKEPGGECTLVASVAGIPELRQVYEVAVHLEQEAIAVAHVTIPERGPLDCDGILIGPKAAEWGEFDAEQFLLLNGLTLTTLAERWEVPDEIA